MSDVLPLVRKEKVFAPLPEQKDAADPLTSVWVGASAGSGKTKVLADRVLRILLTGVLPQRLLCITFTRAAAAEMAIRIMKQLSTWATCDDADLQESLHALEGVVPDQALQNRARCLFALVLNCPGGLKIKTVHSFAQEILNRFPIEAGLSPNFVLLDESEATVLRDESFEAVLRAGGEKEGANGGDATSRFAAGDCRVASLLAMTDRSEGGAESDLGRALADAPRWFDENKFSEKLKEALKEERRILDLFEEFGDLESIAVALRLALSLAEDETRASVLARACAEGVFDREGLRKAAALLLEGSETERKRGAVLAAWVGASSSEVRVERLEDYAAALLTKENTIQKRLANKETVAKWPEIKDVFDKEGVRLILVRERLEGVAVVERTIALLTVAAAYLKDYAIRKKRKSVLDFEDLIQITKTLLKRDNVAPWILFKLDKGIDHILVDEAQDTTPTQWEIVQLLANEFFVGESARTDTSRTLFVVGDEKQSIFSFQGANPDTFEVMRSYFEDKITAFKLNAYREVPLTVSFRSAPAILRAVDAVFSDEAIRQGVSKGEVHHKAHRAKSPGRVEVWPLVESLKIEEENGGKWFLPTAEERVEKPAIVLATQIADKIKGWVTSGAQVRGRKIQPGDILILLRRRDKTFVDSLTRALKERQIAVSGVDRMVLTKQLVVQDLLALLQFLLLPDDDLTLATLLKTPLLGWSEEQLMHVAMGRGKMSLWEAIKKDTQEDGRAAVSYLRQWMNKADTITPFALLMEILGAACPADAMSGRRALWKRLGPDSLDPMDELLNAAASFGMRRGPSLQAFVQEMLSSETEIKREMDQGGGRVRIMTVHGSKGLEAPIVIMPDTTTIPNRRGLSNWLWTEEGLPFFVTKEPQQALLQRLRDRQFDRQLEEYRRLLYVALTRPADQLFIGGWTTGRPDSSEQNWYALALKTLAPLHDEAARLGDEVICFADPLLPEESKEDSSEEKREAPLPVWASTMAPEEPNPPRPLVPSTQEEDQAVVSSPKNDRRFARGRIIHKLLQYLPEVGVGTRDLCAQRFLENPALGLSVDEQIEMTDEVLRILDDPAYAALFGEKSRAEVPLTGLWNACVVSGQVDRLCVMDDDVWIVDFKTNRPPPSRVEDVPLGYRKQMEAYKGVLSAIYPQKTVRCFLLWTYAPRLMEVLI